MKAVLVSLVTYNDALVLESCLEALSRQTVPIRVKVFDNASSDGTAEIVQKHGLPLHSSARNLGYSAGHNCNLRDEDFEFALLLNADVILHSDYLERLISVFREVPHTGLAGGKLLRMDGQCRMVCRNDHPILDSTGVFFTPSQRHFDRGSEEEDQGQYDRRQSVFGITGAALLCSRTLLEDIRFEDEYLDEDFFAYREDADLAWRAQLRGWVAVYEPSAMGLHQRCVLPSRRRELSPLINYHSLKNRYLMRIKNLDSATFWKCFPYMWFRDFGILLYVLVLEWSSIPAYREIWRLRKRFTAKRRFVQQSRRVPPREIARWFQFQSAAEPCESAAIGPPTADN